MLTEVKRDSGNNGKTTPGEKPDSWVRFRQHLKLIGAYFRFNLAASMEYRGSFLLQVFGMILNNASFIVFWAIVYSKVDRIGGYGFREVMFIWALTSSSFGLAHILFGNIGQLTRMILRGELDVYLLQPKDVYINVLCSRSVVSAWGDLAYGITLYLLTDGFVLPKFLLFCLFTLFSGILMGSVMFTAESLTFFIGNASAIGRLVREFLISFTLYPEGIYKGGVRLLIYSLLPAGFIVFFPLRILSVFSWANLLVLLLVDICYILLGYFLFNLGLKRYESGNLLVTKL